MAPVSNAPSPAEAGPSPSSPAPDRRRALLRAALELFADKTYGGTAVPDIAARAQVGTGTVYRHFDSKADLANSVYRHCKGVMREGLEAALASGGDSAEQFLRLWKSLAAMAQADPVALRFLELQHHEDYLDERSRAVSDSVFATAEQYVRSGQRSGAIRAGDPKMIIALVFGGFVGLFKEASLGRLTLDPATVQAAGESVWRMVRA